MPLANRQPVSHALSGGRPNSLRVRVRSTGQLIDLPMGKTTVGSSPRCNLRIEAPGVQPVHCLLVRDSDGLTARRWAADSQLNGAAFDDAPLASGDRLLLGGVELELVGPPLAPTTGNDHATTTGLIPAARLLTSDTLQPALQNIAAATVDRQRETSLFEYTGGRPAFAADSANVDDSTAEECAMLMDAVQDSFDAMSSLEAESTDDAAGEPLEFIAEEYAPGARGLAEDGSDVKSSRKSLVVDEHDTELDIDGASAADADITASDAAEVVFRELQAACAMSRSRSWKMLTALRKEREQKRELLERLTEAGAQLQALSSQPIEDISVDEVSPGEDRDWQREALRLRRQIAAWERQIAEHVSRMTQLQGELAAAKAHEVAESAELAEVPRSTNADAPSAPASALPRATTGDQWHETLAEPRQAAPEVERVAAFRLPDAADVSSSRFGLGQAEIDESASPVSSEVLPPTQASEATNVPCGASDLRLSEWSTPPRNSIPFDATEPAIDAAQFDAADEAVVREHDVEDPFADAPQPASWSDMVRQSQVAAPTKTAANDWTALPAFDATESTEAAKIEVETPVWAGGPASPSAIASEQLDEEVSPFAAFSIWNQGAKDEAPPAEPAAPADPHDVRADSPTDAEAEVAADDIAVPIDGGAASLDRNSAVVINRAPASAETTPPAVEEPAPPVKPVAQPTSFIERYAHLFAHDDAAENPSPMPARQPAAESSLAAQPRVTGVMHSEGGSVPTPASDEEESIEEYMAKLLQRVRGDVPMASVPLAAPALAPKAVNPVAAVAPARSQVVSRDESPAASEQAALEDAAQAAVDWDAIARKAAAVPKADLGALRALANQTARRAISRHELTKHRRDTVTKVIVSMLAGMTSLWLMLDAPSWYDLQCVTAGVALIGAAYWAVEAYHEMTQTWRAAAAYESLHGDEEESAVPLPIDVVEP